MLCDPDNLHPRLSTTGSPLLRFCDMGHILSPLFHLQCCKSIVLYSYRFVCIIMPNTIKQCMCCRMGSAEQALESQIFQVNYAVCLNNKLYIIYADHTNIWVNGPTVSPGGVCFINSGTTTYRWRFKFYLTCCVLVSPRTNVDYFIYIKKTSIHHSAYTDHVLHHVMGPVFTSIIARTNSV